MKLIANKVGEEYEDLEYIFDNICTDFRDSLCIDLKRNSPHKLRKNLWTPIVLNESYKKGNKNNEDDEGEEDEENNGI